MKHIIYDIYYDEETGLPINRKPKLLKNGYVYVKIKSKLYRWHRIIYKYLIGPIPEGMEIDHIDNNRHNNLLSNLRCVNKSENSKKIKMLNTNTVGLPGVSYDSTKKKFRSRILVDNMRMSLGSFDTAYEAFVAYYNAKIQLHGAMSVIPIKKYLRSI